MTKEISERELALAVLLEIERGEKSHIALRQVLEKYQYLGKQERAFLTRLCEGTTERRIELDYIINQFSKVKTDKMKPVIRNLLRCAVYQMEYMDQVPTSAACNEAVNLAVKKGFKSLKGFVNGVLRNIARNLEKISYPDENNTAEYFSIKYSMPLWIVEQWLADYGKEQTEQILQSFYLERPTTIRVNENRMSRAELKKKLEEEGVTSAEETSVNKIENLPITNDVGMRFMTGEVGNTQRAVSEKFEAAKELMNKIESEYNKVEWQSEASESFKARFAQLKTNIIASFENINNEFTKLMTQTQQDIEATEKANTVQ